MSGRRHFAVQPGPCIVPATADGAFAPPHDLTGLDLAQPGEEATVNQLGQFRVCLLYTSDAADE